MAVSSAIRKYHRDYFTGTVYTTNKRVWEYDQRFKKYLQKTRSMAIDMETATIFTVGFDNEIPSGAILLVTDQPMISTGVKTSKSDKSVTEKFVDDHVKIGIESLKEIKENKESVKHLRF
jgi:AMP nucleosidase